MITRLKQRREVFHFPQNDLLSANFNILPILLSKTCLFRGTYREYMFCTDHGKRYT